MSSWLKASCISYFSSMNEIFRNFCSRRMKSADTRSCWVDSIFNWHLYHDCCSVICDLYQTSNQKMVRKRNQKIWEFIRSSKQVKSKELTKNKRKHVLLNFFIRCNMIDLIQRRFLCQINWCHAIKNVLLRTDMRNCRRREKGRSSRKMNGKWMFVWGFWASRGILKSLSEMSLRGINVENLSGFFEELFCWRHFGRKETFDLSLLQISWFISKSLVFFVPTVLMRL